MDQAIRILHTDLSSIRAGRVSTAVVENIKIKVYGGTQELTLSQLGTISITDAQTLTFTPFDISIVSEIERGLLKDFLRWARDRCLLLELSLKMF